MLKETNSNEALKIQTKNLTQNQSSENLKVLAVSSDSEDNSPEINNTKAHRTRAKSCECTNVIGELKKEIRILQRRIKNSTHPNWVPFVKIIALFYSIIFVPTSITTTEDSEYGTLLLIFSMLFLVGYVTVSCYEIWQKYRQDKKISAEKTEAVA